MLCPKCKTELKESITYRKRWFWKYKVYNYFCPSCDYDKEKEIKISKEDYENTLNDRTLKIHKTTTRNENTNSNKKYSQDYTREDI